MITTILTKPSIKIFSRKEIQSLINKLSYDDYYELSKKLEFLVQDLSLNNSQKYLTNRYLAVVENDVIHGVVKLYYRTESPKIWILSYISVHQDYKRQGLSKELLLAVKDFVDSEDALLHVSPYTDPGRLYIKKFVNENLAEVLYSQEDDY